MIYDASTWIGHWPYRRLPQTSAADLLRKMDALGIEKALVGSLQALFYADSQDGNRELVRQISSHRDRLVPCAVLNPAYFGWAEDLTQCREEWGMPVLRLIPQYHPYKLTDTAAGEIVAAAFELKMITALYGRIIDMRGKSQLDSSRQVPVDEILSLFGKFGGKSFMLLNSAPVQPPEGDNAPNIYQDTALMSGGCGTGINSGIEVCTPERLLFGSSMLLNYPKQALIALENADAAAAQKEKIYYRNLQSLIPEMQ